MPTTGKKPHHEETEKKIWAEETGDVISIKEGSTVPDEWHVEARQMDLFIWLTALHLIEVSVAFIDIITSEAQLSVMRH